MQNRKGPTDLIRTIEKAILAAGCKLKFVEVALEIRYVGIVKLLKILPGDVWTEFNTALRKVGFYWSPNELCWRQEMLPHE